jgi:hypothetical protein
LQYLLGGGGKVCIEANQIAGECPTVAIGVGPAINEQYFKARLIEAKDNVIYGNSGFKKGDKVWIHGIFRDAKGEYIVKYTIIPNASVKSRIVYLFRV